MACSEENERQMCKIINDFAGPDNNQDIKKKYRQYVLKNHPDKLGKKAYEDLPLPMGEIVERFNNCTEKAKKMGRKVCDLEEFEKTGSKKSSKNDLEPPNKKTADCIRSVVNWPKGKPYQKFDTKKFNLEKFKEDIPLYSPKLQKLLDNIVELDKKDKKNHNKVFKHFIFTDLKQAGHGAKMIAAGLRSLGMNTCLTLSKNKKTVELVDASGDVFGLLCSSTLFGKNFRVKTRKEMMNKFNSRPDNVHGKNIRIMIVDGGYKEGIDIYDVKYAHLFEPQLTSADKTQAIGRGTRFCGQKGLKFVPNVGWKLNIYTYNSNHKNLKMEELYHLYAGTNLNEIALKEELERLSIESAVDKDLNANIHVKSGMKKKTLFQRLLSYPRLRKSGSLKALVNNGLIGGASNCDNFTCLPKEVGARATKKFSYTLPVLEKAYSSISSSLPNKPYGFNKKPSLERRKFYCDLAKKNKEYCDALISTNSKALVPVSNLDDESTNNENKLIVSESSLDAKIDTEDDHGYIPTDYYDNVKSESFTEFQKRINKDFADFKYDKISVENMCDTPMSSDRIVKYTPSQDFISHYFVPQSNTKGLLVWHSVGSGKTCTAVATKSKTWDKEDYTVLWITRTTLRADIWKNMFDKVCDYVIAEKLKAGIKIPTGSKGKKFLTKNFLPPLSFAQFSNICKVILGKKAAPKTKSSPYYKLIARNGKKDPLKKTLIIIDEAHKLLAKDLVGFEKPDFPSIEKALQFSYKTSKKESCRPLLMTATPIMNDPMDYIRLLNLLQEDQMPTQIDEFLKSFPVDDKLKFKKTAVNKFQDLLMGKISYLNRTWDPRYFVQPVFHNIEAPISEMVVKNEKFEELDENLAEDLAKCNKIVEEAKEARKDAERRLLEEEMKYTELAAQVKKINTDMKQELADAYPKEKAYIREKYGKLKKEYMKYRDESLKNVKAIKKELKQIIRNSNKDLLNCRKDANKSFKKENTKLKKEAKEKNESTQEFVLLNKCKVKSDILKGKQ